MNNPDTKKTENHVRCEKCDKLLAVNNGDKRYEIKCTRCGTLNVILDEMAEQVIVTNPKGIILFVNNAVTKLTGYAIDEVIGQKPSLWGGQMPKEFYEKMWHKISKEK